MRKKTYNQTFTNVWQFLWQIIKPYRLWYILMLQAPMLTGFYIFANNYSFKLLIDAFSKETNIQYNAFFFPVALFLSAQITLVLIWRISNIASWKCEPFVRSKILSTAYNYVQYHSYSYFQNVPSGSIISKLKGILDGYDALITNLYINVGRNFYIVVISIFALLVVNTKVFLFMLIWCLLFISLMLPKTLKIKALSNTVADSKHEAIGFLTDNITNIFSLFYFAKRQVEFKRINDLMTKTYTPNQIKLYKYNFKSNLIGSSLYLIMLTSIFIFMLYLRKNSQISTGDFLFVMLTTLTLSTELWIFITGICDFMQKMGDLKSSFSILATKHTEVDLEIAQDKTITRGDIVFKDLYFSYEQSSPVFCGLNLSIKSGEKIGLIGHSGAGKSTLISLLLKNFTPNSGDILIDNTSINRITADSIREQITLIPQDIILFHRTIAQNIGYAKDDASLEEIKQAAKFANIHDFIESLPERYDTLVGERGIKLSGGQRQRIAIARAILKNAPIIILDEATSSLDSLTEKEIQQSIETALQKNKSTVIAIAHRLSTIRHMDRILVMEGGIIIEEGSFAQLIKKPQGYFKRLWDSQTHGMILYNIPR